MGKPLYRDGDSWKEADDIPGDLITGSIPRPAMNTGLAAGGSAVAGTDNIITKVAN